jgi:2-polyprenyl-3-methyl-5-hydroxy-6-metoxy-1,4-benzoquinol methylase
MMFDYDHMDHEERPFARRLAIWIDSKLRSDVVDLGAGTGVYVEELQRLGIRALGYDIADPQPRPDLVQTKSMLEVTDPAGLVMCLEVAEHIDKSQERSVIESVWRNTLPGGHVIWSAAQPGQGGVGHINCEPPIYWTALAQAQGFVRCYALEDDLHEWITAGYHMGWFARNRQIWHRPAK